MTIAPEATRSHDLQIRTDPAGTPLASRHDGRIWLVDPATDTQHWYGRDAWWDTRRTAAKGSGDLSASNTGASRPRSPAPTARCGPSLCAASPHHGLAA